MADVEHKIVGSMKGTIDVAQRQRRGWTQLFPWENHVVEEY